MKRIKYRGGHNETLNGQLVGGWHNSPQTYPANTYDMDKKIASRFTKKLARLIHAPYVHLDISTWGGAGNESIGIYISFQPKAAWPSGIFHNSDYFIFNVFRNGSLDLLSTSLNKAYRESRHGKKWRKTKVKSIYQVASIINNYVKSMF